LAAFRVITIGRFSGDHRGVINDGTSNAWDGPMQETTANSILQRPFGRNTSVKVSALGFGGHHLGEAQDQPAATRLVREAIDGGITFFDNCREYHRGKTEDWMGAALKGRRYRGASTES
jgi:hypothetical protein